MSETRFCIEYAKRGTAGCKKCKQKIEKQALRIGKIVPNPFSDSGGEMKQWFHVECIFDQLSRARATTKKIEDAGDLEGWSEIEPDDRKLVLKHINELSEKTGVTVSPGKRKTNNAGSTPSKKQKLQTTLSQGLDDTEEQLDLGDLEASPGATKSSKDDAFKEFRKLCAAISEESTYTGKTAIVARFFKEGCTRKGFTGDLYLWVKFLLPMVNKRVYNLQSKQLVKVFSRIFGNGCHEEMIEDLEQGDVARTVGAFFEKYGSPASKSTLTMQDVDAYLERLSRLTREDDQTQLLRHLSARCTANDLVMIVRLIKHDIRINSGPKHILEALHPDAYQAFQASRNLEDVVRTSKEGNVSVSASLMTPMIPMLAEPCGSVDDAFAKCPNGMYAEIKYDGERVQLHKKGSEFLFFSRSLKPVSAHKVQHLKDFIPKAFKHGHDLVLDSEILMVDTHTEKPLPFGTLGIHKRAAFKDASVCLFVFDCLHYNGKSLLDRTLRERREILKANMTPIKNHVMFSEQHVITTREKLRDLINDVLSQGLEGLVLKNPDGVYEPGKRHWLKVKKDYLKGGSMADSADLAVLGAYFGTGSNGGIMSIFLMGCWNPATGRWCTVTKVHGGHDDKTLERLQTELEMKKISRQMERVPAWLDVEKVLVPDFVAKDPDTTQVWEIAGAEFTRAEVHTADGISIRFPRVTRIRTDKTPKEATTLPELRKMFQNSRAKPFDLDLGDDEDSVGNASFASTDKSSSSEKSASPRKSKSSKRSDSPKQTSSLVSKQEPENSATKTLFASTEKSTSSRKNNSLKRSDSPMQTPPLVSKREPTPGRKHQEEGAPKIIVKTEASAEKKKICDFPDVFTGVRMCLPPSRLLRRYFVAYDGTLAESESYDVTHTLSSPNVGVRQSARSAKTVTVDWLWDSIRRQKRQDEARYSA
ncbi:DNA ligase 3 [Rhipicephalus sanguineus]|uniref:DNA ligase 3 n=1 Tax=Rhipicephalus sanguineus TaxID=34632 RepID=UPI0018935751|nr:DNA ligase 3 [Rhipicephalus sanguineus]